MDTLIFVENIKKYCALRGIKPTVACRESGVGRSFMTNLESKGSLPSIGKVSMLASYLGVTLNDLVGEDVINSSRGPEQNYLVRRYNSLPPEVQKEVMAFIEFKVMQLAEQEAAQKKKEDSAE